MRATRLVFTSLAIASLALLGAACGAEEKASEKIAEKIIEESAGGKDVDVDIDGDEVTINSKDGSGSFSTSGKLPEDWPKELALPKGAKVTASTTADVDGGLMQTVTATSDDSPEDVVKHFDAALDGWKKVGSSNFDQGGSTLATASWEKDGFEATITASSTDDGTAFTVAHRKKA